MMLRTLPTPRVNAMRAQQRHRCRAAMTASALWLAMASATVFAATAHGSDAPTLELRMAEGSSARMEIERELRAEAGAVGSPGAGGAGGPSGLSGLSSLPGGERVVKGAPYCAEAVHETIQWLPEPGGAAPNRIVRQSSTLLCRDGEGRTRQEVERGGRRIVYLRDPVAREGWVLDPQRKSARRLAGTSMPLEAAADSALWRDYAEQMREWARGVADAARARTAIPRSGELQGVPPVPVPPATPVPLPSPLPPLPPAPATPHIPLAAYPTPPGSPAVATASHAAPAIITRIERAERGGARESEVTVLRMDRGEGVGHADWPTPPPAVQWHAARLAPRGPGVTTALPARELEGVRANGERTTWVIDAGRVGNERPIQIVREVWTAPELLLTLSSREFDPRTGEVNYRLKNVKRGEPDAEQMRVPADYSRLQPSARK